MATPAHMPLSPKAWLAQQPLQKHERLYLVISAASDADALRNLRMSDRTHTLMPIWSDTPYATWQPVMPYITELQSNSTFLSWIAETEALDWGWLAVSRCEPNEVLGHLRSLTQVKMPSGGNVFFRFWDGRHIHPILEGLGDAAGNMLPVFERYLINGKCLEVSPRRIPTVRDWPWWEVPKDLLDSLARQDPSTMIGSLMQWLEEERLDIYTAWPESNLKLKVARFISRANASNNLHEALLNDLMLEQG